MANIEVSPDQNTVTVDRIKISFTDTTNDCNKCILFKTDYCNSAPCTSYGRKDRRNGIFQFLQKNQTT
jgi:hypothetical protein